MKVENLRISQQIGLGFGVLLLIMVIVAMFGINGMSKSNAVLHHVVGVNVLKIHHLEEMSKSVHIVSRVTRTIALLNDEVQANEQHKKIDIARANYNKAFTALEKMPLDDTGLTFIAKIKQDQQAARALNDKFAVMAKDNKEEAVTFLMKEVIPVNGLWQDAIQEFIDLQESKNSKDEVSAQDAYQTSMTAMICATFIAIVLGMGIAWNSSRAISLPIRRAIAVAQKVAEGDLTSEIEVSAENEAGQLLQALKTMNANLVHLVGQVRIGTDTISTASAEIASGNLNLSSRTESQASSLEETASSMEELTSTVKQNAENARQANQLAISATDVAVQGGAVVAQVVTTMGDINASSKKIVDIISVIDGIAFQTNILALNAAVEAARAGEQGRGFAVVASEVRNLAQRSASAAKEIKLLINDSVKKVGQGSHLVNQAGTTMDSVVASIRNVTDIMAEITAASSEQTSGIEQINTAVTQMDEVTQQNAALVEQAAAAAGAMQEQAANLATLVQQFKINPHGAPVSVSIVSQRSVVRQRADRANIKIVSSSGSAHALADKWEEF
ncbi:methyl-accepting chemotaxis protein [Undibacterium sp. JH2W]|uniref:methyl-accepting chemotaxis protein n=1 Tax=Undibacterium sp. JH2W TaxID=3413037 RepID=UPI003BF44AC3